MARPLSRLGTADVPAALVPMRFAATVFTDDPDKVMPFPALPEITLETAPDVPAGFSPIVFPCDEAATKTPSPPLPRRRAGQVEADVVPVQGDIAGLQRDAVTAGAVHREAQQLSARRARRELQPGLPVGVDLHDRRAARDIPRGGRPVDGHVRRYRGQRAGQRDRAAHREPDQRGAARQAEVGPGDRRPQGAWSRAGQAGHRDGPRVARRGTGVGRRPGGRCSRAHHAGHADARGDQRGSRGPRHEIPFTGPFSAQRPRAGAGDDPEHDYPAPPG